MAEEIIGAVKIIEKVERKILKRENVLSDDYARRLFMVNKKIMSLILVFSMFSSIGMTVHAEEPEKPVEFNYSIDSKTTNADAQIKISDTQKRWIVNDTLYEADIVYDDVYQNTNCAEVTAEVTIFERKLGSEEKCMSPNKVLLQSVIENNNDMPEIKPMASTVASNQAWDGAYTFKITLAVRYELSGSTIHMYNATGTYVQNSRNGVCVTSGELYYHASGKVYKNGKVVVGATGAGGTKTSASGTFNNVTLLGNSTEVRNCVGAGVSYSLYATRGVDVTARVTLV